MTARSTSPKLAPTSKSALEAKRDLLCHAAVTYRKSKSNPGSVDWLNARDTYERAGDEYARAEEYAGLAKAKTSDAELSQTNEHLSRTLKSTKTELETLRATHVADIEQMMLLTKERDELKVTLVAVRTEREDQYASRSRLIKERDELIRQRDELIRQRDVQLSAQALVTRMRALKDAKPEGQ